MSNDNVVMASKTSSLVIPGFVRMDHKKFTTARCSISTPPSTPPPSPATSSYTAPPVVPARLPIPAAVAPTGSLACSTPHNSDSRPRIPPPPAPGSSPLALQTTPQSSYPADTIPPSGSTPPPLAAAPPPPAAATPTPVAAHPPRSPPTTAPSTPPTAPSSPLRIGPCCTPPPPSALLPSPTSSPSNQTSLPAGRSPPHSASIPLTSSPPWARSAIQTSLETTPCDSNLASAATPPPASQTVCPDAHTPPAPPASLAVTVRKISGSRWYPPAAPACSQNIRSTPPSPPASDSQSVSPPPALPARCTAPAIHQTPPAAS